MSDTATRYTFRVTCPECAEAMEPREVDESTRTVIRRFAYCAGCGEFYAVTLTVRRLPAQRRPDYTGPTYTPRAS